MWQDSKGKQPFYIYDKKNDLLALAGLWSHWHHENESIYSCTILTKPADQILLPIHARMPVILPNAGIKLWLDVDNHDVDVLAEIILELPQAPLACHPVSRLVNRVNNDSADCIAAVKQ